ncbi:hypothetical protein KIPB_012543 [Kipferlia bialata]|uniref:Uncharacterized protein n=1 Tax=Kipferlia bialata TaxID=797122 RepID=A0A9K3D7B5_9EUKA|nr:hypothetical protein KIPB_012543 [Kipferlia bialata]|eukprot:g12543.t1
MVQGTEPEAASALDIDLREGEEEREGFDCEIDLDVERERAVEGESEGENVWEPDLKDPAVNFLLDRAVQLETGEFDGEIPPALGGDVVYLSGVGERERETVNKRETETRTGRERGRETASVSEGPRGSVVSSRARSARPSRLSSVVAVPLDTPSEGEGEGEGECSSDAEGERETVVEKPSLARHGLTFKLSVQGGILIFLGICNATLKLRTFFA